MNQTHGVMNGVEANTVRLSFLDEYTKGMQPIKAKMESLFALFVWSRAPIATLHRVSNDDKEMLLVVLWNMIPLIRDREKIDTSTIKKHHEIQNMLVDMHSRGSAYFRQYAYRPLMVDECDCVTCRESMFSRIIIPFETHTELHEK
jgi:hypothetical protein